MLLLAAFSDDEKCPSLSTISFPGSPEASTGKSYNVVVVSDGFVQYAQRVYLECGVTTLTNYNVYRPTGQCVALPPPSRQFMLSTVGFSLRCIGLQESLWYFDVLDTSKDDFQFSGFCPWVFRDYDDCNNNLSLYQKTKIKDISFDDNLDIDVLVGFVPVPITLHPFKPDMICLGWGAVLVSYNMKTRKLEALDIPNGETLRNGGLKGALLTTVCSGTFPNQIPRYRFLEVPGMRNPRTNV
nr:putative F-box/kelch-repeat protein At1g15680 [Ipomoea batatas]GME13709.1 putative F-box/kelch-repeat protein At1g15680 [Ipomoea batatas]